MLFQLDQNAVPNSLALSVKFYMKIKPIQTYIKFHRF